MAKAITWEEPVYLKALFYGKPGSTKTRTAGSAALDDRTFPTLMLECAGNPLSIRNNSRKPDVITITNMKDFNVIYDYLYNNQPENHTFREEYKMFDLSEPYKAVIIDGLTEIQTLAYYRVVPTANVKPGNTPPQPEIQHYGRVRAMITQLVNRFTQLPLHVLLTVLEDDGSFSSAALPTVGPLLWGKTQNEVPGYTYIVGRLLHSSEVSGRVKKIIREANITVGANSSVCLFSPDGRMHAKDQYGDLPAAMLSPTITQILDLIGG